MTYSIWGICTMKDRKAARFFEFLATNDPYFRIAVFYYPLLVAGSSFVLWWLLKGGILSQTLLFSAFMFLLTCFVGLVHQAIRRKNYKVGETSKIGSYNFPQFTSKRRRMDVPRPSDEEPQNPIP